MKVIVKQEWMGHKAGSKLDLKDDYAETLMKRGVVERAKAIMRADESNKQVKGGQESKK